jgi:hypothetical protein
MVEYEPRIIQKFARRLYRRATIVMVVCTTMGVLFGGMGGLGLALAATGVPLSRGEGGEGIVVGLVTALIGGLGGAAILGLAFFLAGREQAFRLRLQAQIALCQVKIEENTQQYVPVGGGGHFLTAPPPPTPTCRR